MRRLRLRGAEPDDPLHRGRGCRRRGRPACRGRSGVPSLAAFDGAAAAHRTGRCGLRNPGRSPPHGPPTPRARHRACSGQDVTSRSAPFHPGGARPSCSHRRCCGVSCNPSCLNNPWTLAQPAFLTRASTLTGCQRHPAREPTHARTGNAGCWQDRPRNRHAKSGLVLPHDGNTLWASCTAVGISGSHN
jgi:hypothetical protein